MKDFDDDKFEEINPEFYLNEEESEPEPQEEELDELSQEFVDRLIDKIMQFMEVLVGHPLHPYQAPFARRVLSLPSRSFINQLPFLPLLKFCQ